jgi:hypothetical protein
MAAPARQQQQPEEAPEDPRAALRAAIVRRNAVAAERDATARRIADAHFAVSRAREALRILQATSDEAVTSREARRRVVEAEQALQDALDDETDAVRGEKAAPSIEMHDKFHIPARVAAVVRAHSATAAVHAEFVAALATVGRLRPVMESLGRMAPPWREGDESHVDAMRWRTWIKALHTDADAEPPT